MTYEEMKEELAESSKELVLRLFGDKTTEEVREVIRQGIVDFVIKQGMKQGRDDLSRVDGYN